MGYIGKVPADVLIDPMVDSAAITDATIVTADLANDAVTAAKLAADSVDSSELVNGSVDNAHLAGSIAMNKTNLTAGTGLTLSTDTLSVDAAQTNITSVGTLSSLTTSGSAGSAYVGSFTNTSATGWGLFVKGGADNADYTLRVQDKDAGDLLSVKAGGRIGVNTNDPGAILDINGDTSTWDGMAKIYLTDVNSNSSSRNWSIGNGGTAYGALSFIVSNAEDGVPADSTGTAVMSMDGVNKRIGIGTASPASQLHIFSSTGGVDTILEIECNATNASPMLVLDAAADRDGGVYFQENGTYKGGIFNDASEDATIIMDGSNNNTISLVGNTSTFAGDVTLSANTSILHLGSRFRMKSDHSNATGYFGVGSSLNNFKFGNADFTGTAVAEINLSANVTALQVIKDTGAYTGYFYNDNGAAQGLHIKIKGNDSGQTGRYLIKGEGYGSTGAYSNNFLVDTDGNTTIAGHLKMAGAGAFEQRSHNYTNADTDGRCIRIVRQETGDFDGDITIYITTDNWKSCIYDIKTAGYSGSGHYSGGFYVNNGVHNHHAFENNYDGNVGSLSVIQYDSSNYPHRIKINIPLSADYTHPIIIAEFTIGGAGVASIGDISMDIT